MLAALVFSIQLMENLTISDKQHAAGIAGRTDRVGDHNDGLAILIEPVKEFQQFLRTFGVQGPGRFIGQ